MGLSEIFTAIKTVLVTINITGDMQMLQNKKQDRLFNRIVSNRREFFCRKSNCIKLSLRELSKALGYKSTTPIKSLYAVLKHKKALKYVVDDDGQKVAMINPEFYWDHKFQEKKFMCTFFEFGYYKQADEYIRACREVGCFFCRETGEVIEEYDYVLMNKHRNSVGKYDADKIRKISPKPIKKDTPAERCISRYERDAA